MTLYLPPSARHFEPRWSRISAWLDHMPFGYDIVEAVRPGLLVELGTNKGISFFTFCQSIKEHDIDALCYAVDTWQGDSHVTLTEAYGKSTYNMVLNHSQENYKGFTYLMRMMFKEALDSFEENSIDLLHIDGFHTYEAVREDFDTWYPKVKPGGIILMHDITARISSDFGVWKFWDEISPNYESFAFVHGFGLGVIRKPGPKSTNHDLLNLLFNSDQEDKEKLRSYYVQLGEMVALKRQMKSIPIKRISSIYSRLKSLLKL
jgi:Methyltransferase domain